MNPPQNRREGVDTWVEVDDSEPLLRRKDLVKKLVVLDPATGERHLRLEPSSGRCLALRGKLGTKARCAIYSQRPKPCRRVQAGDRECRRLRAGLGLDA